MVARCPNCGTIVAEVGFKSKVKQRIFDYIKRNPGATRNQIMDAVYADHPDGGPLEHNVISVHVAQMRKVLKEHKLGITGHIGRNGGYTVIELKEEQ